MSRSQAQLGLPPQITVQPTNVTVSKGGTATFSVEAFSLLGVSFKWYSNTVVIPGATQNTYSIPNVTESAAAQYYVEVRNLLGAVNSSRVSLTVLVPPAITTAPQGLTVAPGANASLNVAASGTAPLSYQWLLNGKPVSGATAATLTLNAVQSSQAGNYSVRVTNVVGAVTSSIAPLILGSPLAQYNGTASDHDYLQASTVDAQGNVYVTGYGKEAASGNQDYVTLKYGPDGGLLWKAVYDGGVGRDDRARALVVDHAGCVYVTGSSELSGGAGGWDYLTVKYNSNGNQLWTARYNGTANKEDFANAVTIDTNGNVFVTGASKGAGERYNYVTLKYDSAGNQTWLARYVGPGNSEDAANAVTVDAAGNVYVTGQSKGSGSDFDYATLKYSATGTQLWVARYNGPDNKADEAAQVVVDAAGNVYVTGASKGPGTDYDLATLKYDAAGSQLWAARYNGTANKTDRATALALDSAGNLIVTGSAEHAGGKSDYITIKYSASGGELWAQRYNGPAADDDQARALLLDWCDNVYVTGASKGPGTGYDFATVKYSGLDGTQSWVARFNSGGGDNDYAMALGIDNQFNLYVGGQAYNKLDFTVVKYQCGWMPPMIIAQPQDQLLRAGFNVSFCVTTAGTEPMGYQWCSNGIAIPGATSSVLAVANILNTNPSLYTVVVTNFAGSVTSAPASLLIAPLPNVSLSVGTAAMTDNGFVFETGVPVGTTYVVWASTNGQDWLPIATNTAASARAVFTDAAAMFHPTRFYKVQLR